MPLGQRYADLGGRLLPRPCRHPGECVVLDVTTYNDGGLRVQLTEWFCCLCNRVVRSQYGTCDIDRRVWCAAMWD